MHAAALAASLDVAEDPQSAEPRRTPIGVLPDLLVPSEGPSMSLGSRRLCTDQGKRTNRKRGEWAVIDAYDNPIVGCIEWRRVTFYRERTPKPRDKDLPVATDGNLTRGVFNGFMSPATKRKVRKCVSTWVRSIMLYRAEIKRRWDPGRAYPVFLTVTLPSDQVHPDKVITRQCLGPFLEHLKRSHGIEHYFWRAESQANGRVHYHILTDRYIRAEDLQAAWNRAVNKLGYVDRYYERTGNASPPSTEIHSIRDKVKDKKTGQWITVDPVDYLMEYVMDAAKPEGGGDQAADDEGKPKRLIGRYRHRDGRIEEYEVRPIDGRVWGMSDSLRGIREPRAQASVRLVTALEEARSRNLLRRVDNDHATMYFGDVALCLGRSHLGMWQLIKAYYVNVFAHLYPAQLPPEYVRGRTFFDPTDLWIDLQEFALFNREPAVVDGEAEAQAVAESVAWFWTVIDGKRTHTTLQRYLDRYPILRKYGTE